MKINIDNSVKTTVITVVSKIDITIFVFFEKKLIFMRKIVLFSLFFIGVFSVLNAQLKKDEVLLVVNNKPVYANEFIRVYNKNLNLVQNESQKNIDEYLQLYIDYKLKLNEAEELGFDKKEQYLKEFGRYKKQLVKNYLTDNTITDQLVEEAYERISYDINANHILVKFPSEVTDTTAYYKQILDLREKFVNQEDFKQLKKELHNGTTVYAEALGWFSGFRMDYDFETVAYNIPVGEVSQPFRTQFGYHVLRVSEKRASKGYVTAAHIFISNTQKDATVNPEERINEIKNLLNQGESFESLAKQYSEHKESAGNGGELKRFKSSQIGSVEFEDEVFKLQNPGDISEPFKTTFGWHIAKLIKKEPIGDFEENKASLISQVKRDKRSKLIDQKFYDGLKERYSIPKKVDLSYFESILNETIYTNNWSVPVDLDQNKILVDFGNKQLTNHDFALYLESNQKQINKGQNLGVAVSNLFEVYLKQRLLAYHEDNLENINPEYAAVLTEYREGLLLFDLMQEKIWNAVKEDSVGLNQHYQANKNNYRWPERVDAVVVSGASKEIIEVAQNLLETNVEADKIKADLNKDGKQNVIVTSGKFIKESQTLPENFEFKKGVSKIYFQNDAFHIVKVNDVLQESEKTFEEAKGRVISEYQEVVEEEWITNLREKYTVDVNAKTLKKVKKALK